jgi:hypothetical protein
MYDAIGGVPQTVALTLYTNAFQVRGSVDTRQRRVTDILNRADDPFIVLSDVLFDEFGSRGQPIHAAYAQINLASVLFVTSDDEVSALPELRTPKMAEQAIISIPPFKVTGWIHLMPERHLREALTELQGHFVPVTDATYWSDTLNEPRATAALVAVNHSLSQILAPHREVDPWAGLDASNARPAGGTAPDATSAADPEPTGW